MIKAVHCGVSAVGMATVCRVNLEDVFFAQWQHTRPSCWVGTVGRVTCPRDQAVSSNIIVQAAVSTLGGEERRAKDLPRGKQVGLLGPGPGVDFSGQWIDCSFNRRRGLGCQSA